MQSWPESASENLVVVSQKNQVKRFSTFLTHTAPGSELLGQLAGVTRILYLDWSNGESNIEGELAGLSDLLGTTDVARLEIPSSAHIITKARHRDFTSHYSALVAAMPALKRVFMFSYEGHYAIFANLLRRREITLCLVEDGLGTYVHTSKNSRIHLPGLPGTLLRAVRSALAPIVRRSEGYSISGLSMRLAREIYWGVFGQKIPDRHQLREGFRDFNFCFSAFPELARTIFPLSSVIETQFAKAMLEADSPELEKGLSVPWSELDCLFLAQTYNFGFDLQLELLQTALDSCEGTLWVKPHPRSSELLLEQLNELASALSVRSSQSNMRQVKVLDGGISAEAIIATYLPKSVFGLTSTALTYVDQLSAGTEVTSFASYMLELCSKEKSRSLQRTVQTLSADAEVLKYFPKVRNFKQVGVDVDQL